MEGVELDFENGTPHPFAYSELNNFLKTGADQHVPGFLNFFHVDMYVYVSTTEAINN